MLSENEKKIVDILHELGAEEDFVNCVYSMLQGNEEKKEENCKKLLAYISAKGQYIKIQDVMEKCLQITAPREQYYPPDMWARCIVKTVPALKYDKVYQIGISFDADKSFLVRDDKDEEKEYPSEYFELQDVSEAVYVGYEDEKGDLTVSDGFESGRRYRVLGMKAGKYQLEGGLEEYFYCFDPVGFKKAEKSPMRPFKNEDSLLCLLRSAFEFGNIHSIAPRLNGQSTFISQDSEIELHGKYEILEHLKKTADAQLEKDVFLDCAFATVTVSAEGNRFPVGTRFMPMYQGKDCFAVAFATTKDKLYLKDIFILKEQYTFKLDEE